MPFPSTVFPHNLVAHINSEAAAEEGQEVQAFNTDMECMFCSMYQSTMEFSSVQEDVQEAENEAKEAMSEFIEQNKEMAVKAYFTARRIFQKELQGGTTEDPEVKRYAEEAGVMRASSGGLGAACKHGVQSMGDQDEDAIKFSAYHTIALKAIAKQTMPK